MSVCVCAFCTQQTAGFSLKLKKGSTKHVASFSFPAGAAAEVAGGGGVTSDVEIMDLSVKSAVL